MERTAKVIDKQNPLYGMLCTVGPLVEKSDVHYVTPIDEPWHSGYARDNQLEFVDEQEATRDWYTRARVRITETTTKHTVDPWQERTFHAGEELEMVQWGRAGRPISRNAWWTSYDIDGAFIIESDKVEIIRIVDEIQP